MQRLLVMTRAQLDERAQRTARMMALFLARPLGAESEFILGAERSELLEASYAVIERDHGGVFSYLIHSAGVDPTLQRLLRRRFVDKA
jgi:hypothetical protein